MESRVLPRKPASDIPDREGGTLSLRRAAIEQFRQPCEIDRHLSRLVHRQDAGVSRSVRVGPAVEHAELLPSGVLDGESVGEFDDPPRHWEAAGHGRQCLAARGFRSIGFARITRLGPDCRESNSRAKLRSSAQRCNGICNGLYRKPENATILNSTFLVQKTADCCEGGWSLFESGIKVALKITPLLGRYSPTWGRHQLAAS